jgi:hypothetical protein
VRYKSIGVSKQGVRGEEGSKSSKSNPFRRRLVPPKRTFENSLKDWRTGSSLKAGAAVELMTKSRVSKGYAKAHGRLVADGGSFVIFFILAQSARQFNLLRLPSRL